jgi:phytoene synthase
LAAGVDLDEAVRRADPDRWLASRFVADGALRADLMALYAFDLELERVRQVTTNPLTAEIRLTWWWEALAEIFAGAAVRPHPLAAALREVVARRGLPREGLEAMIDARLEVIGLAALDEAAALRFADAAGGSAAVLAAHLLDPGRKSEAARPAGCMLALGALVRDGRLARVEGQALIRRGLTDARGGARRLSPAAFPAIAAAALIEGDVGGPRRSELGRRLRLAWAVARGRL